MSYKRRRKLQSDRRTLKAKLWGIHRKIGTGNTMWAWVGGASTTTFDVENQLDSTGYSDTQAATLGWTPDGSSGWTGFSMAGNGVTGSPLTGPGATLAGITFQMDIESVSGGVTPTLWFCQNNGAGGFGGNQVWAASYVVPMAADGTWTHVDITMDTPVVQQTGGAGNSSPWNPNAGFYVCVDGGASNLSPGTPDIVTWDNLSFVDVTEPGTIALLTLGGLGALVAIRRRS